MEMKPKRRVRVHKSPPAAVTDWLCVSTVCAKKKSAFASHVLLLYSIIMSDCFKIIHFPLYIHLTFPTIQLYHTLFTDCRG